MAFIINAIVVIIVGLCFKNLWVNGITSKDELKTLERGDGRVLLGTIIGNVNMVQLGIKEGGNVNAILEPYLASLILQKDSLHLHLPTCPAIHLALFLGTKDHLNVAFYLIKMGAALNHYKLPALGISERKENYSAIDEYLDEVAPDGYPPALLYALGFGQKPTNTHAAIIDRLYKTFPEKFNLPLIQKYLMETGNTNSLLHLTVLAGNFDGAYLIVSNAIYMPDTSDVSDEHFMNGSEQDQQCSLYTDKHVKSRPNTVGTINEQDSHGLTALHIAAWNNDLEALVLLLYNKADVLVVDDHDRTPFHYAVMRGHVDAMNLLYEAQLADAKTSREITLGAMRQRAILIRVDEYGRSAYSLAAMAPASPHVLTELARMFSNHSVMLPAQKNVYNARAISAALARVSNSSVAVDNVSDDAHNAGAASASTDTGDWNIDIAADTAGASYSAHPVDTTHSDIDVLSSTDLTTSLFMHDYFSVQKPVVITDQLTSGSNIWAHWRREQFMLHYGQLWLHTLKTSGGRSSSRGNNYHFADKMTINTSNSELIRLSDFVQQYLTSNDHATESLSATSRDPVIGYTRVASLQQPSLIQQDLIPPVLFRLCPSPPDRPLSTPAAQSDFLSSSAQHSIDSWSSVDIDNRLSPFSLTMGTQHSVMQPQARNASWSLVLVGTVRFYLIAPGSIDFVNEVIADIGSANSNNGSDGSSSYETSNRHNNEWINRIIPRLKEEQLVFETILQAGDVLFIPRNWVFLSEHLSDAITFSQEFCELRNTDHRIQPLGGVIYGGQDAFKRMGKPRYYRPIAKHEIAVNLKREKKSRFPTFNFPKQED